MAEDTIQNEFRKQFIQFLLAKDDNLLLQTSSLLFTIAAQSKVSQSLLYHANLFPYGGATIKSMLLQRLLGSDDSPGKLDQSPTKVLGSSDQDRLDKLETAF